MMRYVLAIALLLDCHASLAQVSTMGTTAMGLPSTPGAIVSSPLYGPSPFSSTTQPAAPDTTLAPVPLALDPTAPGTSINCSPVSAQTTLASPTQIASSGPETSSGASSQSVLGTPGLLVPLGTTLPQGTFVIPPGGTIEPPGTIVTTPGTIVAPGTTVASTASTSATTAMSLGPSTMSSTSFSGSTTGIISPVAPLGSPSNVVCSSTPGGPPTNGAALPLSTPEVPASPPLGTIQQDVAQLGDTSIDPATGVVPTPNTSGCAESMTMYVAPPGTMTPGNATGAAAMPGVSPPGC
jgi:hypothetical protein